MTDVAMAICTDADTDADVAYLDHLVTQQLTTISDRTDHYQLL